MTTSDTPPRSVTPTATVRLRTPAEVMAAVPALLGFHPERSLVLLCLEGERATTMGLVARVDLPPPGDVAARRAIAGQLAAICANRAAPAAVVVVVEDRVDPGRGGVPPHQHLVADLQRACGSSGTAVVAAHHVVCLLAGQRWCSYDDDAQGLLPDPRACAVAAEHVLAGRVIHRSRAELAASLQPATPERVREVDRALQTVTQRLESASVPGGLAARGLLETVLAAVDRCDEGAETAELTVPELAEVAVALGELTVRDACFALSGGCFADAAERLWTTLVRNLPAPHRAHPAVLLAHSSYARGHGPLAGVALQVALAADPGHRMAALLNSALQAALPPETVRDVAQTARAIAADLGVCLPPLRWEHDR